MEKLDLKKLFALQEKLDKRILEEKKITEDVSDLTVVAFKVEFAEFLNEHKFFKFWKVDRTPRKEVKCHACKGSGGFSSFDSEGDPVNDICLYCGGIGIQGYPLLEEFVDGIHFLLSLGIKRKYHKFIHALESFEEDEITGSMSDLAQEVFNNRLDSAGKWLQCLVDYMNFGVLAGITPKDIEEAYVAKNKENHRRQSAGY